MGFHDVRFPTRDEWGGSGGPGNSTAVLTMDSGQERRVVRWSEFRHTFDVAWQVKQFDLLAEVKEFYLSRGGLANSFRYKDWIDYNTTSLGHDWEGDNSPPTDVDQQLGVGDGTTTTFQLVKRYEDDAGSYVRPLHKIVDGTTVIALDGSPTASGWSVNLTTGVVTFDTAPALGVVVTGGCEFDVEVRFGDAVDQVLAINADSFGSGSVPTLPLVEVMSGDAIDEDRHFGGCKLVTVAPATPYALDMTSLLWMFDSTAGNTNAILPDVADVPAGGPIFIVKNTGAVGFIVHVVDPSLASVCDLNDGESAQIFAGLDTAGNPAWFAMVFT